MIAVEAPRIDPVGPWVEVIIATPSGTFQWPPEPYGWGSASVKCKSPAQKDEQRASGRGKAKTKKSGPQPIPVTIVFTFLRTRWEGESGMCALLNAIDPNNPSGAGGPFDFQAADFIRRGGKSIDIDEVGEVDWQGHKGTCTVTGKEWVAEPPKEATQGTKTPDKSTEYVPEVGDPFAPVEAQLAVLERFGFTTPRSDLTGVGQTIEGQREQRRQEILAQPVAARGFEGPEKPTAAP